MAISRGLSAGMAFLLVALLLSHHPATSKLVPRSVVNRLDTFAPLARREDSCGRTQVKPNNPAYEKLCGENSPKTHPCFTHWAGDLQWIEARPWLEPVEIAGQLRAKDDQMTGK